MQKYRILTEIGKDKKVTLELKQDYELLEILSLKFSQKQAYASYCSDYGVVCGRISVNNGLGIPNARVSIFVPLKDKHQNDPVIKSLYPFESIEDKDDNGYKYNLLPSRKQHGGHEPTGTFFDQSDILSREEVLEVYEDYYSYTVKTNESGDFMIWGVPVGPQTLHVDVDLSDIGCFSLRPDDFIRQGKGVDNFKNKYKFKSSTDLLSLPQIISYNKSITVYPFWGNEDYCEIGITRTDFDLSSRGVKIEPKAYLLGSIFSDSGKNTVNKNCIPAKHTGDKCSLVSHKAIIEVIRFTSAKDGLNRPILESYELHEDIEEDGAFVLPLPMNMDYIYTNEFGENEYTNDPNKGVPTSACYRFRISTKNQDLGRVRTTASFLVPNIREYNENDDEVEKSYAWSLNWSDYPTNALNDNIIFKNVDGAFYPQDYFYRFNYNKVYSVSQFVGSYFANNIFSKENFIGIKQIAPKEEDDCENSVVTPPVNWGTMNTTFAILLAIIVNTFERIIYYAFIAAVQVLIIPFQFLWEFRIYVKYVIDWRPFDFFDSMVIEPLQRFGTIRLGIAIYPECETCDNLDYNVPIPSTNSDPEGLYLKIGTGYAIPDTFMTTYGCSSYIDGNASVTRLYFIIPQAACGGANTTISFSETGYTQNDVINSTGRYIVKFNNSQDHVTLNLIPETINGATVYYFDDTSLNSYSSGNPPSGPQGYKLFDSKVRIDGGSSSGLNSELAGGCQDYSTVYNEAIVKSTYCVDTANVDYGQLSTANLVPGSQCAPGKFVAGQTIYSTDNNKCETCDTHSGYSEFRYGLFTIVPAASTDNWGSNFNAITEYSRRKLVAKLFCEGLTNYSFIDNWLTGALYMFGFKAKVRWDNEEILDLNYRHTRYCKDVVYFKVGSLENPDKRFYYRSTYFRNGSFSRVER